MPDLARYDAIVVGSGAGGGFAAMALAESGLRVLLLERGRRFDFTRDYPMNYDDWERRHRPFEFPTNATVVTTRGMPLDAAHERLFSRAAGRQEPRRGEIRRAPFRYNRAVGLGGSTLHYDGEAHRFADYAFTCRSEYGFGTDWPIGYRDLEPFYRRAEQVLGVAGEPGMPFKPPRGPYPTPAHRLSPASLKVRTGAERLGWHLWPNPLALPTRPWDGRSACRRSGGCVQGCIFGAKSSTNLSAIARAESTGRLEVRTQARAVSLLMESATKVSGIEYLEGGERKTLTARAYVLSLGAIETPRLLLASANALHPAGIGNRHDQVGRYLMENMMCTVNVFFGDQLEAYKGPPIGARIWDFARSRAPGCGGFVLGVSGSISLYHGPLSYAENLPGFGRAHKQAMRERFGNYVSIWGMAEQEPRAVNRLRLSDQKDSEGVPKVRVDTALSESDISTLKEMLGRCETLAEASGAREIVSRRTTYDRPSASHAAGTCRMGHDPENSVTDAWGLVHGMENLYLADASVLVSQGAGDSPSLTIQALAMRTAERIASLLS